MKKSLILGLTALLAVSLTFFSCNNANQNDPTGNTPTTDEPAPTPDTDEQGYNIDLSSAKLVKEDWASSTLDKSGSELIYTAQAWGSKIDFEFSDAIDLSKYTKINVTAYADSNYEQGTSELKVEFYTDENGTELCNSYSEGFLVLTTTSTTYTADLSKGGILYEAEEKADFSKISKIRLNAQSGSGKIYIAKICFE